MTLAEQTAGDEWRQAGFPKRHMEAIGQPVIELTSEQASAKERVDRGVDAKGIVVLAGDRGCGKTFLASLIANERCYRESITVKYTKLSDWLSEARHRTIEGGEAEHKIIAKYARIGLVVIDEAQDRRGTEYADEMFTRLIDARYMNLVPTIVIANLRPNQLEREFGRSFMSRVTEGGGVIDCQWESMRNAQARTGVSA